MFCGFFQQERHRLAFVHKQSDIAFRLSQHQGTFQRFKRGGNVTRYLVRERLQHQNFDDTSHPVAGFRCLQKTLLQGDSRLSGGVFPQRSCTGDEHSRQGDVFVLPQVAEVVLNGQTLFMRPTHRFSQPTRCCPLRASLPRWGAHQGLAFCNTAALPGGAG